MPDREKLKVWRTKDYGKFKKIDGNRTLDSSHIEQLSEEVKERNLLEVNPILVSNDFTVIDGQHRLAVASELGEYIYYIKKDGLELDDIRALNKKKKVWNLDDYAESYASKGLPAYKKYVEIREKYGFCSTVVIALIRGVSSGGAQVARFRSGQLELPDDVSKIEERIQTILDFDEYIDFGKSRSFVRAIQKMTKTEGYDHDWMINRVAKRQVALVKCVNAIEYLRLLEDIYNYGTKIEGRIRFT